jgi:energy-coupling factor transporter ATP-binding protein EcfA2
MITQLTIRNPLLAPNPVLYWPDVAWLKRRRKIKFGPGLNIIYGKNGSGKSTLIKALAALTHTLDTNWPAVTRDSISMFSRASMKSSKVYLTDGLLLEHDGAPAKYLGTDALDVAPSGSAASQSVVRLKISIDLEGRSIRRMSQGQMHMAELIRFLRTDPERVRYCVSERKMRGKDFKAIYETATESLKNKPSHPPKNRRKVILLDEVDRSMDLINQELVWNELKDLSRTHQIIVASHSVLALNIPGATYIETSKGKYLAKSREAVYGAHV